MKKLAFLGLVVLLGCAEAQQGTAKALDNAGSVVRSGTGKLWLPSDSKSAPTSAAASEQEKKDEAKAKHGA